MQYAHDSYGGDLIASSTGLLLTRVAAAAARARTGTPLQPVEVSAVRSVLASLQSEVDVLRGRREATVIDEPAYAMAGFTLGALSSEGNPRLADDEAANLLEGLIARLKVLLDPGQTSEEDVTYLQELFLSGGNYASMALSGTGERTPMLR